MESDSGQVGGENILIVDDNLENLQILFATLSQNGYTVQTVISGSMALTVAVRTRPDLILLDIVIPGIDGYEVCKLLKESKITCDIPIIFLSGLHNVSEKIKVFKLGGADYITKPFQVEEVLARVKHQLTIQRLFRKLKEENQQLQREITQRREAEVEAVAASQAKSNFLANMSHELRTPLNAIIGFSKLMSHDSLLNAEQQENIRIINQSAEHLLELINDVLELSKIEAGIISLDKTSFDLYRLLDNIEEMFQFQVEQRNINLNFIVSPNVPQYIKTDVKKLRSCLNNLIANAIKFTPQGSVTLQVSFAENEAGTRRQGEKGTRGQGDKENIILSASPNLPVTPSPHLLFQVEDTGCGISEHELDKLFDAFTQAEAGRKSLQGTGLGLAITRKFVQIMGGEIQVTSTVGKGSIFTFDIEVDIVNNNQLSTQLEQSYIHDRVPQSGRTYGSMRDLNSEISENSLFEELMTMPQAWLRQLHQAANQVNEDLLQSLIEEIPENKISLSQSLTRLVNNFRLDIILQFTQKILGDRE